MAREISIHGFDPDGVRAELRHVVEYFSDEGHRVCELVFGWHWGMEYPPGAPWRAMRVPLAEVEAEIDKAEGTGIGELGRDDVTLRFATVDGEFWFCHHGGVHLTFCQPGPITRDFLARWTTAGRAPVERECGASR